MTSPASRLSGPLIPEIPTGTIGTHLDRVADHHGSEIALIVPWQGIRWTWSEFRDAVDRVASGFQALDLKPGDRVGILSPNCYEWVLTQFATARVGLILVSINPAYRAHELEHALRMTGVRALITARQFKSSDYLRMLAAITPLCTTDGSHIDNRLPELQQLIVIDQQDAGIGVGFDSLLRKDLPLTLDRALDPAMPVNIQFTSGTTGSPKGATLSHANLMFDAQAVAHGMGLTVQDRLCIPVPLYHCFGMVLGVLACLASGAAMVFPAPSFEPDAVLRTVEAERCTALHGVPTMFLALLDHPDFKRFDVSALRTGIAAGAPCPPQMMRRLIQDMHLSELTIGYGMTETSPVSAQTRRDSDLFTKTETVGYVLPHTEVRIVDATGGDVPVGTAGEYVVRGPGVMLGYWNDPEATRSAVREGWMHSGDLAKVDAEGRVYIVGRIKDMIIRGGENIYPAEIEAFLLEHPAIGDAAVFGLPDERLGEVICAWIRPKSSISEEEVRSWCRGRIAHYKVPLHVKLVESFPMTVTGKIQKFVMAQMQAEESMMSDGAVSPAVRSSSGLTA